jgi:pSer/pThr/pTyr-binding forkhead associated (FHA) protein
MDSPVIQLRLKGRVVQTLPFQGRVLRIGRMKENDIAINNASVSRFHAVLRHEGGRVILEDSGSENGCYVNGTRVVDSIELEPGDEVLIGKHQLVLSEGGDEDAPPSEVVKPEKSDAWDASNTYFVGVETQAKLLEGARSEAAAAVDSEREDDLPPPCEAEEAADTSPPEEMAALADDAEIESAPEPIEDAEPGAESDGRPFEFGMEAELASAAPADQADVDPRDYDVELIDEEAVECDEQAVAIAEPVALESQAPEEPVAPESPAPEEPTWHAGLIIQHQGRLERIISWDQDRLVAGRSRECEIFLDQPEISRRHAMFVRDAERHEVRDLDSINGVLVNGERVKRRDLELGDVVNIEEFELTFLLDRQPIASEVKTDRLETPVAVEADRGFDMTMIDEVLPVRSASADPALPVSSDEALPVSDDEAETEMLEGEIFEPDDAKEEELVEVQVVSPPPSEIEDPGLPVGTGEMLTFEVRVRVEDLPRPLRAALADFDGEDLRLPVEIVLKNDG